MESERPMTAKVGERPGTHSRRDSGNSRNVFEIPPTGVPKQPNRTERPTSRRGIKSDVQDLAQPGAFRAGTPGRNIISRPPSASVSSHRMSTASSRINSSIGLTRLNTGLPASSFSGNPTGLERPITQQGIAAARPGSTRGLPRMSRQIQDKRYYEGLVQLKIRELTQEIATISRELDAQNKERATFLHFDQRAKDLASELTDLQGQLADYNIVVDKMTSDTEKGTIEQEAKELAQLNDLALSEIERMFDQRQRKEKQLRDVEKNINFEKKNADRIADSMDRDAREKYDKLHSQKSELQEEIDRMQREADRFSSEKASLEERIALSQVKQEAVKLHAKIMEIEEKRDRLRAEEKNRLSPEEEKDRLLQKVKQDNVDIAAGERRIVEMEKRIGEVEQELEQLETDLDEDRSDKLVKYKELRKREEVMEEFMSTFNANKEEEQEKSKKLEVAIVDRLENISGEVDGEGQLTDNQELAIIRAHHGENRSRDQGFDGLRQEHTRLQRTLNKMENLEKRLKVELKELNEKIEKRQSELVILEDLDGLKMRSETKREETLKEREQLKARQPSCNQDLEAVQNEYDELKHLLNKNETYLQISALEEKLEKLKENNDVIQASITEQKDRTNYGPIKERAFSLVARYNFVLTESIKPIY